MRLVLQCIIFLPQLAAQPSASPSVLPSTITAPIALGNPYGNLTYEAPPGGCLVTLNISGSGGGGGMYAGTTGWGGHAASFTTTFWAPEGRPFAAWAASPAKPGTAATTPGCGGGASAVVFVGASPAVIAVAAGGGGGGALQPHPLCPPAWPARRAHAAGRRLAGREHG